MIRLCGRFSGLANVNKYNVMHVECMYETVTVNYRLPVTVFKLNQW